MITVGLETLLNTTNYTIKSWGFFYFYCYWKLNSPFQEGGLFNWFELTSLFQSQGLSRGFFGTDCVCLCLGSYCMP